MAKKKFERKCSCDLMKTLSDNVTTSIEYDEELNEYNMWAIEEDREFLFRMYYCFFCGGKLPESKRQGVAVAEDVIRVDHQGVTGIVLGSNDEAAGH